jgi:hypothetical protein
MTGIIIIGAREVNIPAQLHLTHQVRHEGPLITLSASYRPYVQRYEVTNFTLQRGKFPITGGTLRHTAVRAITSEVLTLAILEENRQLNRTSALLTFFKGTYGRALNPFDQQDPSSWLLQNASVVFTLARLTHTFPVRAIERCFGITYRDAQRWVRLARRRGFLPEPGTLQPLLPANLMGEKEAVAA